MKEFEYVIRDENGIHARPAGLLVKQAKQFQSQIFIYKGESSADSKKLFALMGLGVKQNNVVRVTVDGPDEAEAEKAIREFLTQNL